MSTSYEVGSRRRLVLQLAVLVAAVAVCNAQRAAWNDLAYYDFLRRARLGEVVIRGATGITRGQVASGTWSSGSSFPVTLGSAPTDTDTLIIVVATRYSSAVTVSSITQTGASWSLAKAQQIYFLGAYYGDCEVWYAPNVSGAGTTITVNLSGSSLNSAAAVVSEYGGLASAPLDKTASNSAASGTALDSGTTATTTLAQELWVGGFGDFTNPVTISAATNGFQITKTITLFGTTICDKIVSSTGTSDVGVTSSGEHRLGRCQRHLQERDNLYRCFRYGFRR